MAEGKKSFILYSDLMHNIDHLTNEEKGVLFNHLLEYVNDLNPVLEDRVIVSAWKPIERQLKRDLVKYTGIKESKSEAGKRSAEIRALKKAEQNATKPTSVKPVQQSSTNPTVNDNGNENDNVNDNVILLKKETKGPPDLKEFLEYASEKCEVLNYNYCEQKTKGKFLAWQENNWVNGNGRKIKNWKTSLLNALPHIQKEKGPAQKENGLDILREFNRRAKENEHLNNYE